MTTDILSQIIAHKKNELRRLKQIRSEASLRSEAEIKHMRRPFIGNLLSGGSDIRIIAEIKRASPSKGDIRLNLDPSRFAAAYERGGASAISVLTETKWFKGSNQDLTAARQSTCLPVLRKDFIISTYQIYESAVMGADAILLIARILSKDQLKEYLHLCHQLQMDALVEIHTLDDIEKIQNTTARLIGINNRNLRSFDTDVKRSVEMSSYLSDSHIPVALSGIHSKNDIQCIRGAGIRLFLIGESIVLSRDPEAFIRFLLS